MEKVKLSTLSKDTIVIVDGYDNINTVSDIKEEDIADLQKILDKILARGSSSNVAYNSNKLIEIDI